MKSLRTTQVKWGIVITLFLAGPAFAQYSGTGSSGPGYGAGKAAIGVGVGAAAAGGGVAYLTLRHRGLVTGCVQGGTDGLNLVDDKKHQTYSLMPGGTGVKVGERVELKGKRSKDGTGTQVFEAHKVVKNLGACSEQAALSQTHSASK